MESSVASESAVKQEATAEISFDVFMSVPCLVWLGSGGLNWIGQFSALRGVFPPKSVEAGGEFALRSDE